MSKKLGQEPAYPFLTYNESGYGDTVVLTDISGNKTFLPFEKGMSKRFYAAIKLRVPDSGEEWLDEMIRKANRRDAAQFAMQGILASNDTPEYFNSGSVAKRSFEYADELLKQESNEQT